MDQYLQATSTRTMRAGDFGITAGMLGAELARMINPDVEDEIKHLAAVAAVGDRSEAPERALYLALVKDKYPEEELKKIALALDYEQFWLRYNDGKGIVDDILGLRQTETRHNDLVELLNEQATKMINDQLDTSMPHVKIAQLPNGAMLHVIDVRIVRPQVHVPRAGQDHRARSTT